MVTEMYNYTHFKDAKKCVHSQVLRFENDKFAYLMNHRNAHCAGELFKQSPLSLTATYKHCAAEAQ